MPLRQRPHSPRTVLLALLVVAVGLVGGCGDSRNDEIFSDARARADAVVAAAPGAYDQVIEEGNTGTPAGRERVRAGILATTDALLEQMSAPFDAARSTARAEGNEDDERFDNARRDRADLILDAQDAALAEIDALDDPPPER